VDEIDGLPVTSLPRTLVDIAAVASSYRLGTLLDRVLLEARLDMRELDAVCRRVRGHRGVPRIRAMLGLLDPNGHDLRSGTERRVRDALVSAGVPAPAVNLRMSRRDARGLTPDLRWPTERLVVEIDGAQHAMPYQRRLDAERDAWLSSQGYSILRVPVAAIDADLPAVVASIREALAHAPGTAPSHAPGVGARPNG
jgi:hypothetical protein